MGARDRVGIGLSYWSVIQAGEIDSLELILGLRKSSKIRAQAPFFITFLIGDFFYLPRLDL
jgi:hypothetical protein